jgi:hypothetical protein
MGKRDLRLFAPHHEQRNIRLHSVGRGRAWSILLRLLLLLSDAVDTEVLLLRGGVPEAHCTAKRVVGAPFS